MTKPKPAAPQPGRWSLGAERVEELLDAAELEIVEVNLVHSDHLMSRAEKNLNTASSLVESNPEGAFTLLYDAARMAITSVLARQGLRPTTRGGHIAVETAVRAQLGRGSNSGRRYRDLRRVRNEVEYPDPDTLGVGAHEVEEALVDAGQIVREMKALAPRVGPFA